MLEGTVGPDGKPIKAVGAPQLKILRAALDEASALKTVPTLSAGVAQTLPRGWCLPTE